MDDKPPMPAQPTTAKIEAIPSWAADLSRSVKDGFNEVRADLQLVASDVSIVKERVRIVERRLDDHDTRASTNSTRVKAASEVDLQQDAAISQLTVDVAEVKSKVSAIHTAVVGTLRNPKVVFVGKVIFAAAVAYSGLHGLKVLP